jgi:hypothetical protein
MMNSYLHRLEFPKTYARNGGTVFDEYAEIHKPLSIPARVIIPKFEKPA